MRVSISKQDVVANTRHPTVSLFMETRVRDEYRLPEEERVEARGRAPQHSKRPAAGNGGDAAARKEHRDRDHPVLERFRRQSGGRRANGRKEFVVEEFYSIKDEWRLMEDISHDVSKAFGSKDGLPPRDDIIVRNQTLYARRTRSLPVVSKSKTQSSAISVFKAPSELGKSTRDKEKEICVPDSIEIETERNSSLALKKQVAKTLSMVICSLIFLSLFFQFLHFGVPPIRSVTNNFHQNAPYIVCNKCVWNHGDFHFAAHLLMGVVSFVVVTAAVWRLCERPLLATKKQLCSHCVDGELSRCREEEAHKIAERAQVAKQQFMAYVFHNIRVPFNAIVLGLGHMRATGEGEGSFTQDGEKMDLVQMMLDCAETMTSVLNDVMDMGKWEVGKMELNNIEFSLLGVINFLTWGLKDLIDQNQICFSMRVEPRAQDILSSHNVIGDKQRILQTLGNFLSNAIKFSNPGGKMELELTCEGIYDLKDVSHGSSAEDTGLCRSTAFFREETNSRKNSKGKVAKFKISVRDDGIGISELDQSKLFEPYAFVSAGWVQKGGVSGLGLSMARRFVERVGGRIGVESEEGKGSTFYFTLPFPLVERSLNPNQEISACVGMTSEPEISSLQALSVDASLDSRISSSKMGNTGKISSKEKFCQNRSPRSSGVADLESHFFKRRVLLVEDTQINRIILRKVLQNLNLHCEEAENGKVAVDYYKEGRTYDLILMDKEMPVMDGHEATRQIRKMGVNTPIIALTGNAMPSDREMFLEAGVDDFQTKPLTRDKLVELLSKFGVESSGVGR